MLVEGIVLKCAQHIQASRTTAAIFHILSGKKSIQAVQDAHIYHLQAFYGIHQTWNKQTFDRLIDSLEQNNLLAIDESSHFTLTKQGASWLAKQEEKLSFTRFNGIHYHTLAPVFSNRLLLLIQTLTNSCRHNFSFIPVVDKLHIQVWMKTFYTNIKANEGNFLQALYGELYQLLSGFQQVEANMFVDRLTGYQLYGKSIQQLAQDYHFTVIDVQLLWTRMIHQLLSTITLSEKAFPALQALLPETSVQSFMTNSANRTYRLLKQGHSVETIADMRQLKNNTIYDHIVEIALFDSGFPVSPYVTDKQYGKILGTIERIHTYSLKPLKEELPEDISYFQIRLVLATMKNLETGKGE